MPALLIRSAGNTVAFRIDSITGQQPVSLRPLPGGLDRIPGYAGGSILGDGDACIVLNLPALAQRHGDRARPGRRLEAHAEQVGSALTLARPAAAAPAETRHIIFKLHGRCLAMPLALVREILAAATVLPRLGAPTHLSGYIEVRGHMVTVLDLAAMLGVAAARPAPPAGPVLVVEAGGSTLALMVDQVDAVADIALLTAASSTASSTPPPDRLSYVAAAAYYGSDLITVLDTPRIFADAGLPPATPLAPFLQSAPIENATEAS